MKKIMSLVILSGFAWMQAGAQSTTTGSIGGVISYVTSVSVVDGVHKTVIRDGATLQYEVKGQRYRGFAIVDRSNMSTPLQPSSLPATREEVKLCDSETEAVFVSADGKYRVIVCKPAEKLPGTTARQATIVVSL